MSIIERFHFNYNGEVYAAISQKVLSGPITKQLVSSNHRYHLSA